MGKGKNGATCDAMPSPAGDGSRFERLQEQIGLYDIQMVYRAPDGEMIFERYGELPGDPIPRYLYIEQSEEGLGWGYASDDLKVMEEYMENGRESFRRWEAQVAGLREETIEEMELFEECEPAVIYDLDEQKVVRENNG